MPKEEQAAIMQAIQQNLDDFEDESVLSDYHIAFIKQRVRSIETGNQPTYLWQQVREQTGNRWGVRNYDMLNF